MTPTQQYGADLFRQANAAVVLDEDNNRFSKVYAPIMDRLLLGEGTSEDVDLLNSRVLDGSDALCANRCYGGRVIAFRNRVSTISLRGLHIGVGLSSFFMNAYSSFTFLTLTYLLILLLTG